MDAILERWEKVQQLKTQNSKQLTLHPDGDVFDCPVCDCCPLCESEGHVPGAIFDYDALAAGIQVFGIGDDLEALQSFVKHLPEDIPVLFSRIAELEAALKAAWVHIDECCECESEHSETRRRALDLGCRAL